MSAKLTVSVVNYGVGNYSSIINAMHALGYRCKISREQEELRQANLLLLPGVGAFPTAMEMLHRHGLVDYLQSEARSGKPILGICLGMQLFADSSTEFKKTAGLGLITGQVVPVAQTDCHIGWNNIEVVSEDPLFMPSDGKSLYFNHSYMVTVPSDYQVAVAKLGQTSNPITVGLRYNNVVGLQCHLEKSQGAGRELLLNIIEGLCRA